MTAKKAPAKKPAKQATPQVPPTRELYSASCKIEELSMNLDKAIAVIDLIQEASLFPGSNANALWAASDIVEDVRNKLDDMVKSLVEEHRRIHGIKHEFHNDF